MYRTFCISFLFSLLIGASTAARDPSCTDSTVDALSCSFNNKSNRLCNYVNLRMDDGGLEWYLKDNVIQVFQIYAPGGSKARIRAPVPKDVNAVCIELMYKSALTPDITVFNELEDGSNEKVIGRITDQAHTWTTVQFHSCVAKDSYISFQASNSEAIPAPVFSVDNIKVTRSNMVCSTGTTTIVPKCGNVLKSLSCKFEDDFCGFSNKKVYGSTLWKIRGGVAVLASSNGGARDRAELIASAKDILLPSICIEFAYRSVDAAIIRINNKWSDGSVYKKIGEIQEETNGEWKVARFNACIGPNSFISLEAKKYTTLSVISLQYIKIRESSTDCSLEPGNDKSVIG